MPFRPALAFCLCAALGLAALSPAAFAEGEEDEAAELGIGGLMSGTNRADLPPIMLSAGQPLAAAPLVLKSGTYYEIEIEADGSQELALAGPGFFRAIWIDELVVEGIEVRPLGLDSLEFDEAGTLEMSFIAVRPGSYELFVPGSEGGLQRLAVTIE